MKVEKKIISNLPKCYSIGALQYNGEPHFLVAAEKVDRCLLFNMKGEEVDTVWTEPGGVMTMLQVPGTNGQFLATHKFYSPNDSKEAKIVIATPKAKGDWEIRTLVDLPFVHRFGILERNGVRYLIACALKSGHDYKEDWTQPGKVYAAVLPEDLSAFNDDNQLQLSVIKEPMGHNHGYTVTVENGQETAIISADEGVFQFVPPACPKCGWEITQLIDTPASDAVLMDLDGDGEKELLVMAPFHGEKLDIYKKVDGKYVSVYTFPEPVEFLHAIYGGVIGGKPQIIVGHRKGKRNLMAFSYDKEAGAYTYEILDENVGSANCAIFKDGEQEIIVATNREIDEAAMYFVK